MDINSIIKSGIHKNASIIQYNCQEANGYIVYDDGIFIHWGRGKNKSNGYCDVDFMIPVDYVFTLQATADYSAYTGAEGSNSVGLGAVCTVQFMNSYNETGKPKCYVYNRTYKNGILESITDENLYIHWFAVGLIDINNL